MSADNVLRFPLMPSHIPPAPMPSGLSADVAALLANLASLLPEEADVWSAEIHAAAIKARRQARSN